MTIDELIAKVDNDTAKAEQPVQEAQATPAEQTEDLMPIGAQFAEYCESKKRK